MKALRFHPCLYFLIEMIVGVVEVFLESIDKKAKALNILRHCFRCEYVLVQLMEPEAFRNSEYCIHPTVTVTASALSSFR